MFSSLRVMLLQPDGSRLQKPIVGMGRTGVIVQLGDTALKLPLKYSAIIPSNADVERFNIDADISYECLQREKEVYQRLGQHDGIVSCLDLSGVGIQMALMTNGNL